ncbi:hypothetical protein ASD21_13770 [Caulobacter sp. Root1455]|uniref:ceramidase domain-containing protein n=1 Tax=Caulobacter sp. Root1455 TaxID=1736465 RepID=UPI0006F831B8|nr:ceramidase domain-containing protein [Caulobacter sp. Root1455]KQY92464.1 hypothetical protein ASD21_13770 [Caulobacter sp. Root1455]
MGSAKGFVAWGVCLVVLMVPFLIFVSVGWPANPDDCTNIVNHVQVVPLVDGVPDVDHPDSCYCEAFDPAQVDTGAAGIRQPVNTLSNLYAIASSLVLVFLIRRDRESGVVKNVFYYTESWVPEVWVFAVMFLGLGSMWFHASLSGTVSWFDSMSMYVFAAFLPVYTVRRRFNIGVFFYCAYAVLVIVFTMVGRILHKVDLISMKLIATLIGVYFLTEIGVKIVDMVKLGGPSPWWDRVKAGWEDGWVKRALLYWGIGVACFGFATMFQILSQTGGPMCWKDSWFQPHGLLWHTLAGAMAVMVYLYWRELPDEDVRVS